MTKDDMNDLLVETEYFLRLVGDLTRVIRDAHSSKGSIRDMKLNVALFRFDNVEDSFKDVTAQLTKYRLDRSLRGKTKPVRK